MHVSGYSWAGVRTEDFAAALQFFGDVLGLPLADRDDSKDFAQFRLPSGQLFEIFGPRDGWHKFLQSPVLGFEVESVRSARREMEAAGVEFVTEVRDWAGGQASSYFRGPDGHIYELWQPAR
jgi:catechol 2,3-dioxygenase-like lactoylglutathione lyase family enzyme